MHHHPKGGDVDPAFVANDETDDREQAAIFLLVLELHPAALTMDELIRQMIGGRSREIFEIDAIQRAVGELVGSGLLHRPAESDLVLPTRAGVRLHDLWQL